VGDTSGFKGIEVGDLANIPTAKMLAVAADFAKHLIGQLEKI
jgi:hypothetical protein